MKKTSILAAGTNNDVSEDSSSLSSGTEKSDTLAPSGAISLSNKESGQKSGLSFKSYRAICMAKKKVPYKLPKLVKCKSGHWYVRYFYRHPETLVWIPFKERCGINYIKDLVEKEKEAEILIRQITDWLMSDHSPFDSDRKLVDEELTPMLSRVARIKKAKMTWTMAIAIAKFRLYIEGQGYTHDTIRAYKKYIKAFEIWLSDNNYLNSIMADFTEMEVAVFLNDCYHAKDWSERTYNNYLEFMITYFTLIRNLERIETRNRELRYNFYPDGLKTKLSTPQRNRAFTPVMLKKLKEELRKRNESDLKDYLEWIFLSAMRPAEIRELRVSNIDEDSRQIRINGKTGDRIIPISDQLLRLINRRELFKNNLTSYIFGYAGKVDERRMSVEYFLIKFSPLREPLGLDDNYGPYSMKPTGIIAMINAGFTDEEIMGLTGHKTVEAFRAYKRDLVIENSHVMKGSTIEF